MFITFEGIDFCGKSTQVKLLKEVFEKNKKKVKLIREPGGTHISERIREILLDKKNSGMVSETELLLFSASRAQLIREIIKPHLGMGYYVISDRFHDSLTAYQGYGRGLSMDFIRKLNDFVIQETLPDITFFLDITLEEVDRRKASLQLFEPDRIESSENNFYFKVREGYLKMCESEKRFIKIDASLQVKTIHNIILSEIEKYENKEK